MIRCPVTVQRRAWECAFVLMQDFPERLTLADRVLCVTAEIAGPDAIGWHYAGQLFALWGATVEVRV